MMNVLSGFGWLLSALTEICNRGLELTFLGRAKWMLKQYIIPM